MTQRGVMLFALMSLIWGIPYLLIRVAVEEISPTALVFSRTLIGAAILLPIAAARLDLGPIVRRWRWLVLFAIVEIGVPWVFLSSAEQHLSSSLAALLLAGVPLVGAVIAQALGSADQMDRAGAAGLLVGLVGVGAIVGGDFEASGIGPLLQMAVVVVCYAVGPVILTRRLAGLPSLGVLGLAMGLNALLYLPIMLVAGRPTETPTPPVIVAVAILGVVCTALAFVAFAALIGEAGPVRATVITYVNPAVAAVLGVAILQESFTVAMTAGFILVIAGSALSTRPSRVTNPVAAPG